MLRTFFHPSLYSNTAESKFPLIDPRHIPVLCSLDFPVAVIKLDKAEDTAKMNLPEENGSDASVFTTYPVVTSDSLTGIQGAQIQLERGWEDSIFLLLKCKEFWGKYREFRDICLPSGMPSALV